MTQERVNQINRMLANTKERFDIFRNACNEYVIDEFIKYNLIRDYEENIYELNELTITVRTDEAEAMDYVNEYDDYADYKEDELHKIIAKQMEEGKK